MEFILPVKFEINPAEWAQEYDLASEAEAIEDIKAALTRAVEDGGLAEAIVQNWPMMRDAATVTIAPPIAKRG